MLNCIETCVPGINVKDLATFDVDYIFTQVRAKSVGESARVVAKTIEKSLKSFVLDNSNLFEALNLRYFGPIDGHDVNHLVKTLEDLKKYLGLNYCIV